MNDESTTIVTNRDVLKLFHPKEAFEMNLRGYISSITPALKCRTDVQGTDGKGMLLKYASSYVTKWHDAFDNDALYSKHVSPYKAAYRHLRGLRPLEPEMVLTLTSKKISWSKSRTKSITVHTRDTKAPKSYEKYLKRSENAKQLTYRQWLRKYVDTKANLTQYKQGNTLVGAKMRSFFSEEFFYQDLVLNYAQKNANELFHPNGHEFPEQIRNFAAAWFLRPEIWSQEKSVKWYLNLQGHKDHYVETALNFWRSRVHYLNLCQRQVIGNFQIDLRSEVTKDTELTRNQTRVKEMVKDFLMRRSEHYDDVPEVDIESESSNDDSVEET